LTNQNKWRTLYDKEINGGPFEHRKMDILLLKYGNYKRMAGFLFTYIKENDMAEYFSLYAYKVNMVAGAYIRF